MFVIGLTGGIGSGKSTVAKHLAEKQLPIIDTDVIAREVVALGKPALKKIVEHFGVHITLADGNLNRPKLREIIFSDPSQRTWLEKLLHPIINDQVKQILNNSSARCTVLMSPLLLETDQHLLVNHILVVDVPEEIQIKRIQERDNIATNLAQAIIATQIPRQERLQRANSILDNSGNKVQLLAQIDTLYNSLIRSMTANKESDYYEKNY